MDIFTFVPLDSVVVVISRQRRVINDRVRDRLQGLVEQGLVDSIGVTDRLR